MKKSSQELQDIRRSNESSPTVDKSIDFANHQLLDLSGLTESQVNELKHQYSSGLIDIQHKAAELKVDVAALDATLTSLNNQTEVASSSGASATITHTQTTSIGRTEVVIGNTEKAAKGKISRTGSGDEDKTLWIIGIIAIAAVLVALAS